MNEISFLQGLLNLEHLDQTGRSKVVDRIIALQSKQQKDNDLLEQQLYKDVYVAAVREGKALPSTCAEQAVEKFRKFFNAG